MTGTDQQMTAQPSLEVRGFFAAFERASNQRDLQASATQFADVFLSADPNRVTAVTRQAFLDALPQRAQLFASIGHTGTRLVSLKEAPLDDRHVLADTTWETQLEDGDTLTLSSVFLSRREPGALRIVFYLNRQDIVAVLGARGAHE